MNTDTDFDVLIIGAGISGIGAACYLTKRSPAQSFAILDGRDQIGGTWSLFKYPGIRSDSDLHTFGFAFKPWTNKKSIAAADLILDYLKETVDEFGIEDRIRFGHRVLSATWSSDDARWTVTARQDDGETVELTCRFLFSGTGYYDYEKGYRPEFPGEEDFAGQIIHPQFWPEDLDYKGKKMVVIGSGATAVTIIPSVADETEHVTMLQRSPSYMFTLPAEDPFHNTLSKVIGQERAYPITRRKNVFVQRKLYKLCQSRPKLMRKLLRADAKRQLPDGYDIDTHFNPSYDPWDQRMCLIPDGDLFRTIRHGKASVVTDTIERFEAGGIRLSSGDLLEADIIVTATGLNMLPMGGITFEVDGEAVDLPNTTVYKSMMLSGVPNFAFAIGYTNSSWTLKVDLVCDHLCRLLNHMAARGSDMVVPVLDGPVERRPLFGLTSGYVQRGIATFPHAGDRGAWTAEMAYEQDVARLRTGAVDSPELQFRARAAEPVAA